MSPPATSCIFDAFGGYACGGGGRGSGGVVGVGVGFGVIEAFDYTTPQKFLADDLAAADQSQKLAVTQISASASFVARSQEQASKTQAQIDRQALQWTKVSSEQALAIAGENSAIASAGTSANAFAADEMNQYNAFFNTLPAVQ